MAVAAVFVQAEHAEAAASGQRNAAYLRQALSSGEHSRLGELLAGPTAAPGNVDRYPDIIGRVMAGLLGHDPAR
jgi:hypothetical protein